MLLVVEEGDFVRSMYLSFCSRRAKEVGCFCRCCRNEQHDVVDGECTVVKGLGGTNASVMTLETTNAATSSDVLLMMDCVMVNSAAFYALSSQQLLL